MGTLIYGALQRPITIDDRTLAHVEAVTMARLRRKNSFVLRWTEKVGDGHGRRSIWVHESADLYFEYESPEVFDLDRALLERLTRAADSNTGMDLHFDAADKTVLPSE